MTFLRKLTLGLLALSAAHLNAATTPVYLNSGTAITPDVDAAVVLNSGLFEAITIGAPYQTKNTVAVTNYVSGFMLGAPGFQFDKSTPQGHSRMDSFVNLGEIDSSFSSVTFPIPGTPVTGTTYPEVSWTMVNANYVRNAGIMQVDDQGLLQLTGNTVDLTRGGLRAGLAPGGLTRGTSTRTSYTNPTDVHDVFWGVGTDGVFDPAGANGFPLTPSVQTQLPNPRSQTFTVTEAIGGTLQTTLGGGGFAAYARTNQTSPTNILLQVVFVSTNPPPNDPQFGTQFRFAGATPIVEYSDWDIDAVTGLPFTNTVYFLDQASAVTNRNLIPSTDATGMRPFHDEISRATPAEFVTASTNPLQFVNAMLSDDRYSVRTVTNYYAGYSAYVGPLGRFVAFAPPGALAGPTAYLDPTNLPARIEVTATNLDATQLRAKADGVISMTSQNYFGSAPRKLDSPNFILNLGNNTNSIAITNLIPTTVKRFHGTISGWTAFYTNQLNVLVYSNDTNNAGTIITNRFGFPGGGPNTNNILTNMVVGGTNVIDVVTHILIVTHQLVPVVDVMVRDFAVKGNDVTVADQLTITNSLNIDANSLTVSGTLNFEFFTNVTFANFKRLTSVTNLGTMVFPLIANFGFDRTNRYSNFVNSGFFEAQTVFVKSANFINSGTLFAFEGPLTVEADAVKLIANGDLESEGDITFTAGSLFADKSTINVNPSAIVFNISGDLSDSGKTAANQWTTADGFRMSVAPASGSLLGTTIVSAPPNFHDSRHLWATPDLGPSLDAYNNSLVIGHLTLGGGFGTHFSFYGATGGNALYVGFLEFGGTSFPNGIDDLAFNMSIDPTLVIYFADSNLPDDLLNGMFDGRLVWVPSAAALALSSTTDHSGSGTPSGNLSLAKAGATLDRTASAGPSVVISWIAAGNSVYQIESSDSLTARVWTPVSLQTNSSPNQTGMRVSVPVRGSGAQFYRVRKK